MASFQLGQGEVVRADMTAPGHSLIFPTLELILITGLMWIAIGYVDAYYWNVALHNTLVIMWMILAVWRFVLPVIRNRRQRFMVTNKRVVSRPAQLRAPVTSIPLREIHSVRRHRNGISIAIYGYDRALFFEKIPRAKKIEKLIDSSLTPLPARW